MNARIPNEQGSLVVNSPKLEKLFQMLEREPRDTFLLYGIGMEYKKLGDLPKSIEYFSRTIEVDPNYSYAYYQQGQVFEQSADTESAKRAYRLGIESAQHR